MKHAIRIAFAFAFAALGICTGAEAKVVTFEIPDTASLLVTSLNDKEQVTGWYLDPRGGEVYHGFLWQRDGGLVTFDVAGAQMTLPSGISANGTVAGSYYDPAQGITEGFIRAADGSITTFNVGYWTETGTTNKKGWTVGAFSPAVEHPLQGFLRGPSGTTRTFRVQGAKDGIFPSMVNRSRAIAGTAVVQTGNAPLFVGFFRPGHGSATLFGGAHRSVIVAGINDAGTVAGTFLDANHVAFVRTSDGTLTTFQGPNGATDTQAFGIDNSGTIAGFFAYANGDGHSFLRAADGTFTLFDVKGSVGSWITAMNGKGAIAGRTSIGGRVLGFAGKP